jgi:hypothetical protein
MDEDTARLLTKRKSPLVAIILTLAFGGVGLFYASFLGGVLMTIVEIATALIALITFGLGKILFIPVHLFCMIWAIVAVDRHNDRLVKQVSE